MDLNLHTLEKMIKNGCTTLNFKKFRTNIYGIYIYFEELKGEFLICRTLDTRFTDLYRVIL